MHPFCIMLSVFLFILGSSCDNNTEENIEAIVKGISKMPYVNRTEKEINDWFKSRPVFDAKKFTTYATNGEPLITLIDSGQKLIVNGIHYNGTLCISQTCSMPNGPVLYYVALVGINVENNTDMFRCGEIELNSCQNKPSPANLGLWTQSEIRNHFREAIDTWLSDDIVATLKSSTNKDGFPDPANMDPREPATQKGSFFSITNGFVSPSERTIGFFAI